MTEADITARIRRLNDTFRQTFVGGRIFITAGVQALGDSAVAAILHQVRTFSAFTPDNDPYGSLRPAHRRHGRRDHATVPNTHPLNGSASGGRSRTQNEREEMAPIEAEAENLGSDPRKPE